MYCWIIFIVVNYPDLSLVSLLKVVFVFSPGFVHAVVEFHNLAETPQVTLFVPRLVLAVLDIYLLVKVLRPTG